MSISESILYLGHIWFGRQQVSFIAQKTGNRRITIVRLLASCGCHLPIAASGKLGINNNRCGGVVSHMAKPSLPFRYGDDSKFDDGSNASRLDLSDVTGTPMVATGITQCHQAFDDSSFKLFSALQTRTWGLASRSRQQPKPCRIWASW
jgi:hypothetical protein